MSTHRAPRPVRPASPTRVPVFGGSLAAVGVVAVALGAGSPAAEPVAGQTEIPTVTYTLDAAPAPAADGGAADALWFGLLGAAAVAGAVGSHRLVGPIGPGAARRP